MNDHHNVDRGGLANDDLTDDGLTDEVVGLAEQLVPGLAARAAESERLRQVAPASIAELTDAGLFGILTPTTHGGFEAGLTALVEALFVVSEADSAAGWVQMVSTAHAWMTASFPEACQQAVFGHPNPVIPGTLASQGRAEPTDGGWLLSGQWQFASGIDHGDWVMIGAGAKRSETNPGGAVHLIVPKADLTVLDTWHVLGLRGSGSHDVVADETFVPHEFSMGTDVLFDGLSPHGEHHTTHLYRLPVLVCLSTMLTASVVGIANAAFAAHRDRTSVRDEIYTRQPKSQKVGAQMRIAEARLELDTAKQLVRSVSARCDQVTDTGVRLTLDERVELKTKNAYAVELCRRATERLFSGAGAHALFDDSELQGRYRDVNTACHHAIVDLDGGLETFGRSLLGLDPGTPLV